MELIKLSLKEYKKFICIVYKNNKNFINNKFGIMDLICKKNTFYYKNSIQDMVGIKKDGNLTCAVVLITHNEYKENLMFSFFEALENHHDEVNLLIDYANNEGKRRGCKKIFFGIDGNCCYSIGYLTNNFNTPPSFGQSFNPPYYSEYFENKGYEKIPFVSFHTKPQDIDIPLLKRVTQLRGKQFNISYASFTKEIKDSLRDYTNLTNEIFKEHRYYFNCTEKEDMELFSSMAPILNKYNLIFAEKDGKKIGFIFWYFDYNELTPIGKYPNITTWFKYRILRKIPKKLKIVEFGVLPEYEGSGVIIILLYKIFEIANRYFPNVEEVITSWILKENNKSRKLTERFLKNLYMEFATYETDVKYC